MVKQDGFRLRAESALGVRQMRNQQIRPAEPHADALDDRALRLGSYIAEHGAEYLQVADI